MDNNSSEHMPSLDPNEFEFGCITPTSPSSKSVSPADEFFLNGRLLPHSFPVQARRSTSECTTSRTSSIGSKDSLSLLSSRSNSTSSSARTSASDVYERKAFQKRLACSRALSARERLYGSSQRWQFITPAPVLDPSLSRRRRCSGEMKLSPSKIKNKSKSNVGDGRLGFCQRILRSFVNNCRACHAMEGAAVEDDHDFGTHLEIK